VEKSLLIAEVLCCRENQAKTENKAYPGQRGLEVTQVKTALPEYRALPDPPDLMVREGPLDLEALEGSR